MSRYALIVGDVVQNVALFAAPPGGGWVAAAPGVAPGWVVDGGELVPPAEPAPMRHITYLAFRSRYTSPERIALEIAALDDPSAGMPARQLAAALRSMLADAAAARYIDLDRADTRAGVQQLEALGLLTEGRATEILDAPVQPHERP